MANTGSDLYGRGVVADMYACPLVQPYLKCPKYAIAKPQAIAH
jgi:hypothetical protein